LLGEDFGLHGFVFPEVQEPVGPEDPAAFGPVRGGNNLGVQTNMVQDVKVIDVRLKV
jgi:hypothetical protein